MKSQDGARLVVTLSHAEFCTLYVQYRDNWLKAQKQALGLAN